MKMKSALLATVLGLSGSVLAQSPTMFISAIHPQLVKAGVIKTHLAVTFTPKEDGATYILRITRNLLDTNKNLAANCVGSYDGGGQLIVQTGFKTVHSADCAASQTEVHVQLINGKTHAVLLQYTVADENDKSVGAGAAKRLSTYFLARQ